MAAFLDALMLSSMWELLAVALAVAYLTLAIRQSLWCWPAAAIGAAIYTILFADARLYMESLLHAFYLVMAGYGFWQWKRGGRGKTTELKVSQLNWRWHFYSIIVLSLLSLGIVWLLTQYTDAEEVYLDTFTTVFSFFATFLVTKKILETWYYWLVIDSFYVFLFWSKGFYATALLFALYTVMVVVAFWRWRQDMVRN